MTIRPETPADYPIIAGLIQQAFANDPLSDHQEQQLVAKLREHATYVPELALVAEVGNILVGFILLTKIEIVGSDSVWPALALAPVAVSPAHQAKGIGAALIEAAHQRALSLGHTRIVLLGHAHYYPRFGYERCDQHNITLPIPAPPECCMVIGLEPGALAAMSGMVKYSEPFGI